MSAFRLNALPVQRYFPYRPDYRSHELRAKIETTTAANSPFRKYVPRVFITNINKNTIEDDDDDKDGNDMRQHWSNQYLRTKTAIPGIFSKVRAKENDVKLPRTGPLALLLRGEMTKNATSIQTTTPKYTKLTY